MTSTRTSPVTETPPASPSAAADHFRSLLEFETDCADVNSAMLSGADDFALLDVRSHAAYTAGHIAGAHNLPRLSIDDDTLAPFGDTTFVVYCAGPHCNGADKAALRLAELGRPVKKMIGGITGWLDEGLTLTTPETTEQS